MKIARIIGAEDVRNVQLHGHAGAGDQMIPFAESFNESMTATAIAPGDFKSELPDDGASLRASQGLKQSRGERPNMAHLFKEALAETSSGSKKALANEEGIASRSEGTSQRVQVTLKDRWNGPDKEAPTKVEPSAVKLDGDEGLQPAVGQQKDLSATDAGSTGRNEVPSVDPGPKGAPLVDAQQGMPQEDVHASKVDRRLKETMKTHPEGVQHKASKREAVDSIATAPTVPEVPATVEMNAPGAMTLPVPAASSLPRVSKETMAGDSSSSPKVALPESRAEMSGKTQAAQKKNPPQVLLRPSKTEGGPKQSDDPSLPEAATDTGKGQTRAPGWVPKKDGEGVATALPAKGHSLSPENAFHMVSPEPLIQGQRLPISQPEKSATALIAPAESQHATAPTTVPLYEADAHKMLAASPTSLEVGVPGGTHGWLKVRAELDGDGAVHASVASNSPAGTEMLRRELPSLTSYLHQEQLPVSSIVVHASSSGMDARDLAGGGRGHEPGQGTTDPQAGGRQENGSAYQVEDAIHSGVSNGMDGEDSPFSGGYAGGGGWLSIRA